MPIKYEVEYPNLERKYINERNMVKAQAIEITKLQKRITNLEEWNREMYENHKVELEELDGRLADCQRNAGV